MLTLPPLPVSAYRNITKEKCPYVCKIITNTPMANPEVQTPATAPATGALSLSANYLQISLVVHEITCKNRRKYLFFC